MHKLIFQKRVVFLVCLLIFSFSAGAGEHHTLVTGPLISSWPEITDRPPIKAVPLEEFLMATEPALEITLANEERWACLMMDSYAPLPEALAFKATGNVSDVRKRFF